MILLEAPHMKFRGTLGRFFFKEICYIHENWKTSGAKRSFWKLLAWNLEEVSHKKPSFSRSWAVLLAFRTVAENSVAQNKIDRVAESRIAEGRLAREAEVAESRLAENRVVESRSRVPESRVARRAESGVARVAESGLARVAALQFSRSFRFLIRVRGFCLVVLKIVMLQFFTPNQSLSLLLHFVVFVIPQ